MKRNLFVNHTRSMKLFIAVTMVFLLTLGMLKAEKNYVKNGNIERIRGRKLLDWKCTGQVMPKAIAGVWRRYIIKFNSRKYNKVNFYFWIRKGSIGSIWIDNVSCVKAKIKHGSFEKLESNGRFTSWITDNFNTAVFPDYSRASEGKKSVRITFKNEAVPDTQVWQRLEVEPNKKYVISYDIFVGDDFQGTASSLIYDSSGTNHLTSNYSETFIDGQLATRDRCEKYVAVLTASVSRPAEIFQNVDLQPTMNLQISADINMKKFKGKASLIVENAVSGEILRKVNAKDVKNKWQNLFMLLQNKSSKIRVRVIAEGKGSIQVDNIAVTSPRIIPPLQSAKWLSSLENFIIPSKLSIFIEGQSGKAINGGLELLSKDLKKFDISLARIDTPKASLQILVGTRYAVNGKSKEAYNLRITKTGIVIKATREAGAFYGLMTLLQLLEKQNGKVFAIACDITDYPDMPMRGILYGDPEQAARWKMNTLMFSSSYLSTAPQKERFNKLMLKCQKLNLNVIPYFLSLDGGYYVEDKNPNLAAGIWVQGEEITLHGTKPSALKNKFVIRTAMTDVKLTSYDGGKTYKIGKDYKVLNGYIALPYAQTKPKMFSVARVDGSSIPDGSKVLASYDYVSHYRGRRKDVHIAYCPLEPEASTLMSDYLQKLAKNYSLPYIFPSLCLEEFGPNANQLATDSRVIKSGKSPIELFVDSAISFNKAVKSGNPKIKTMVWAGHVNKYSKFAGPRLSKDIMVQIWGYDANWPATYGKDAIEYWSKLGFETSVMSWDNLRNIQGWAQVVAYARKKGYPCIGMIGSCWAKRTGGFKETAIVSWKIPKKGERGFVNLKKTKKPKIDLVAVPEKAKELGKEMLINGDFEIGNPPKKWQRAFDITVSQTNKPQSGKHCLKIVQKGKDLGYARQNISVITGKRYQLSLWYKCRPGSTARIEIWDHANGKNLFAEHKKSYTWTEFKKNVFIPAKCKKLGILLYAFGTGSTVWYDNVSFKEIKKQNKENKE